MRPEELKSTDTHSHSSWTDAVRFHTVVLNSERVLSLDSGHRDGSNALNKPSVWWQTVAKVSWQWRDIFTRPPEAFCSGRRGRTPSNQNTRTVPVTFHWAQLLALWQPTGQTLLTGERRRERYMCVCVCVCKAFRLKLYQINFKKMKTTLLLTKCAFIRLKIEEKL